MKSIQARFGLAVRRVREAKGWSQERLAEACQLDRTYISGIERGRRNPSLASQARIASALEVALSHLIALAEEEEGEP